MDRQAGRPPKTSSTNGETSSPYPHTFKEQRAYERQAQKTRDRLAAQDIPLPAVCGYTYRLRRRGPTTKSSELRETAVCARNAGQGTKHPGRGFCDYHEVQSKIEIEGKAKRPQTSSKRSQVQAALQIAANNARFFGEYTPIGPHDALAQEVARTNAIVTWLETKLQRLKDDGTPEDDILRQYAKMGIEPSVWMTLFHQERQHLIHVTAAAIKAGVAERRQQLAEDQARLLAGVMLAFIHDMDLGLSPEQIMKAPSLIRKHMLALPQTEDHPIDVEAILEPEPAIRRRPIPATAPATPTPQADL